MSNITLIREREHSFSIQTTHSSGRTIFISTNTFEESDAWREEIITASTIHKQNMAQACFKTNKSNIVRENDERESVPWRSDPWDEASFFKEENGDESRYIEID